MNRKMFYLLGAMVLIFSLLLAACAPAPAEPAPEEPAAEEPTAVDEAPVEETSESYHVIYEKGGMAGTGNDDFYAPFTGRG